MNVVQLTPRTSGDLSVLARPTWLREHYDRIVLIAHRRHLPHLDARDSRTLVLSTDWLAWRQCLDTGIACLHFEALLGEWPEERGNPDDINMRRCDWMLRDGRDVTLFRGVSLGKLFIRDVAMGCNAFERIWYALDRAIRRFGPAELVLYDLRAEHDLLDESVKIWMVGELAKQHKVRLISCSDVPPPDDPGLSERSDGFGVAESSPLWRRGLRHAYAAIIDAVFRFRTLGRSPPGKILLIHNWATTRNLIRHHQGSGLAPTLIAEQAPKQPVLIWKWWWEGVVLVAPPSARLDAEDRRSLAVIRAEIENRTATPDDIVATARHLFITRRILATGWIEQRALEVKRYLKLFRRHRFARVVVGDATNGFCRLVAECASVNKVPCDELPNGMFVTRQLYDARLGGQSGPPVIDRVLSWGPFTHRWLAATGAHAGATVGYPALDDQRTPPVPVRFGRALVLPIYADADDPAAFTSNIFGCLVDVVRALRKFGCAEIRVKVHVGPQNRNYYADVLRHFDLDVPVIKDNALPEHLHWADFVVGPVNSGAFVETLAVGKPYFPILPSPSRIDPALLGGILLVKSAEELVGLLDRGNIPARDVVLEDLCSFVSIPNASRQFWRALSKDAA